MLLLTCLVRAGVFAPHAVINAERSNLENSTGFTVLLTLFAACAQVFTLVTPEHGLLHAVFAICFFVQLTTTLAGVNGRRNMLRSLLVLLGSAFVVRFVVLESLYTQDGGFAKRIVTALIEGASLGSVQYEPAGAGTGYVAFFTLTLFFVGLVLLPPGRPRSWLRPQTIRETPLLTIEGELDDISGHGQTEAAHALCLNIPREHRSHFVAPGVGHYGIFSGRRWREIVFPRVREFIRNYRS